MGPHYSELAAQYDEQTISCDLLVQTKTAVSSCSEFHILTRGPLGGERGKERRERERRRRRETRRGRKRRERERRRGREGGEREERRGEGGKERRGREGEEREGRRGERGRGEGEEEERDKEREKEKGEAHVSHKEKKTYERYQSHHLFLLPFLPLSLRPHLAASMPSQVELSLISTRSLLMLACSYSSMNRRAFAIEASLS